jgi:3-(3-hydroxy-phenyl)propionate hydroxylase
MEGESGLKEKDLPINYDLIIIGYGMVGSVATLLALQYKLKVAVLEIRKTDDLYVPKAGRIDAETVRILEQLGFSRNEFNGLKGTKYLNAKGKELLELKHEQLEGFETMYSISQPDLQLKLHHKIQAANDSFTLFEKHRAEAIELKKDRVKIIAHDLEKDEFFEINSRFLIACNGQESLVPAQCDFNYRLLDYTNYSLNLETQSSKAVSTDKYVLNHVDGAYPLCAVCDDEFHQRWEFRLNPDEMAAPDIYEQIRKELDKRIMGDFEILNSYVYKFETRILEKWQRKRIFITGDAAHVIPPFLGMGLSAGMKDVYNLIWKIALVSDRRVKGQILDSYQPEREEEANQLIKAAMSVQQLSAKGASSFFRKVLTVLGLGSTKKISLQSDYTKGVKGMNHQLAGKLFPCFKYKAKNGASLSESAVLSTDFIVAAFDTDPVDALNPSNIEYMAQLSARFIRLDSKARAYNKRFAHNFTDADNQLTSWFRKHKINYIIIRPDKLIFDAFKTEKQLNKAVKMMSKMIEVRKMGNGA